ncbi:Uncharacterized protein PCOAH_00044490 [Plasmodium coatneyi]|uniref:Uncharacterized protein n=1 Tax=Plasmodium coatneyi TaxID=208452 RepID=A0A1B1E425_9APIC|nr:Uncharacterized protein PCOAH_00044490 [Plasmodium coatneyi]ANQ09741.1 Uncharacterized protein PCOAH_00044490 [Plasmodium coatneyi]
MDIHNSREGTHGTSKMDNKKAKVKKMLHGKKVTSKVTSKVGSKGGSKGGTKRGATQNSQARTPKGTHLKSAPKEKSNIKTVIHSGGKSFKTKKKKLKKKCEHVHTVSDNNDEHVKALLHIHHSSDRGDTDEEGNSISLNNFNGTKYVSAKLLGGDHNGVNSSPNDETKTKDHFRKIGENFINSAWSNHDRSNDTCTSRINVDCLSGSMPAGEGPHDVDDDADDVFSQSASEKCEDSPSENLPPPHVHKMDKVKTALEEKPSDSVNHIIEHPDVKHSLSCTSDEWNSSGVEEDNTRTPINNIDNTNDEMEECRTESIAGGISQGGGSDDGGGHPEGEVIRGDEKTTNKSNLNEPLMEERNEVDPHEGKNALEGIDDMDGLEEGKIGTTNGDYHIEEDRGEMENPTSEEKFNAVRSEEGDDSQSSPGGVLGQQVNDEMSVAGDVQQQGEVAKSHDENGHNEETQCEDYQGERRQVENYPLDCRPNEPDAPPITPQEEKFDWRKILNCNIDTSNGGQGEMEKLNLLINFRDSAEKYLQSYINSFLNDFFLMSSYLPYLHYYDQDAYEKKEMNFLKMVTHFMDHFHCNKKMSKQIRDFKNDFVNSPINEKIKYVDKFPFLKLSEMCTDRVKCQFLKIFMLKEKWVENNFLQIGLNNELGPPVEQQQQQDDDGEVEERQDAKTSLEKPPLKEPIKEEGYLFRSVKERSPNGRGQMSYNQMGEKFNNDIFCEQILSAPFLKQGNISNSDFTMTMKTMVHSSDDRGRKFLQLSDEKKMEHPSWSYPPHSKHSIRKRLNNVVRNKLFNVLHLSDAKYREKIHVKNEDRRIMNNISFYKNKINRLYAYLMFCTLMGHSPNFEQPNISWNGGSNMRGDPREDLQGEVTARNRDTLGSSSNEVHTKNVLNEKDSESPNRFISFYNLIKISNEFVKNNGSSNKGGEEKNKIPRNYDRESLSKDMDILTRIFLQDGAYNSAPRDVGQNGKISYISTLSSKANMLSSSVEWGMKNSELHNGKGALEGLTDGAVCIPHVRSKLDETGNETLDKWEEVSGGKRLTSGLSADDHVNRIAESRTEPRPDERHDLHLPVNKGKTDGSKFQLSPDLQFLYDAYNNGEQIIVVKNKKKVLHNLGKCTKFARLSKRSLFHANDSGQNGIGPSKGTPSTGYKSQMGYVRNTNGVNFPNSNSSDMAYSYYGQTSYDSNVAFSQNAFFRQRYGEGTDRGYTKGSFRATSGNYTLNSNHNVLMNHTIDHLSKFDKLQNRVNCVDSNNTLGNNSSGEFTKCRNLTNGLITPQYVPNAVNYINGINSSVQNCSKGNLKGIGYYANGNNISGSSSFSPTPPTQQPFSNYLTGSTNYVNQFDNSYQNIYNQMGNTKPFLSEQMERERSTLINQNGYPHFALTNNYFSDATNSFTQNGQSGGNNCGSYYNTHGNLSYTHPSEQKDANNVARGTLHTNGSKQMDQTCVDLQNGTSGNHFECVTEDGTYSANPQDKRSSEEMVDKDNDVDTMGKVNHLEGDKNGYLNDVRSNDLNCTQRSSTTSWECKGGDYHKEDTVKSYPPGGMNELLGEGSQHVVNTDVAANHEQCHGNDPNGDEQGNDITATGEDHPNRDVKKSSDHKNEYSHDKVEAEKESPLESNNNSSQNSGPDVSRSSPEEENTREKNQRGDNSPSTEGTNLHVDTHTEGTINGDNHDGSAYPTPADVDAHIDSPHQSSNSVTPLLPKKDPSHEDNTTSEQLADPFKTSGKNDEDACSINVQNQPRNNNPCGSIGNLDMGIHSVEGNTDNTYNSGSAPFGGNGDEKSINFNDTLSSFNVNEMGAPMDGTHIGDNVRSSVGINKSNHTNSIDFSTNNTCNETKYKMTEEMVNVIRQTDAYAPPCGHYQLSNVDTSMANVYKQFNLNGIMPPPYHNGRSNNMKNYPNAEMRNHINVHNYNMNKNENVQMRNECLSNLPTHYGYLYNYNTGNYFLNGANWVGLENRTGDRPVRNNMNFTNYNGTFNEYCDGDEEEWDPQQEGPHEEGSHQEDDDRSGGSFPSSSNLKKRDKTQKEKKNASMNTNKPQPFGLNASKKKRLGNNGPPTAEKLSELLHEKNLSVPQIAAIYGVHRTTVARWCHNRKVIQKSNNYQGRKKSSSTVGTEYT